MQNGLPRSPFLIQKNRRGWLRAFGVAEFLLGLAFLLLAVLTLAGSLLVSDSMASETRAPISSVAVVGVGLYTAVALFFFVVGVGTFQCRNWARIVMLVASGFALLFGVLGLLMFFLVFPKVMESQGGMPAATRHLVFVIMIWTYVLFGILLPLVCLVFYTREGVKATCLNRSVAPQRAAGIRAAGLGELPAAVVVLTVCEGLGAAAVLGVLVAPVAIVFGFMIHGWKAAVVMLAHSALSGTAAWLIFRQNPVGWTIATVKTLVWGASTLVTLATFDAAKALSRSVLTPEERRLLQRFPQFLQIFSVISLVFVAAYLSYLAYARRFFVQRRTASVENPS